MKLDPAGYEIIKRGMDVIGGLLGTLMTSIIYLPIALLIKCDSHGPVIFAQERVGKNEQLFKLYKFRTMALSSSVQGPKPGPDDERMTRLGRFLRRSSLDEFPQFVNVLGGDMSLVGPRPEQPVFAATFQDWQRRRFIVKPGLTGWWQVNGRKQPMGEHIDEDIFYVENRSLWLDLKILLRTVGAVLSGKGAV
jgi:lipopolysaccharide/colanic/teichoic acid biosynthesis glycosyltransferase